MWRYQEQKGWDKYKRCLEAALRDRKKMEATHLRFIDNLKSPARNNSKNKKETGQMAQWVTLPAAQAWRPDFDPQNPHEGGEGEPTPQGYPLTSTCALCYVCAPLIINPHENKWKACRLILTHSTKLNKQGWKDRKIRAVMGEKQGTSLWSWEAKIPAQSVTFTVKAVNKKTVFLIEIFFIEIFPIFTGQWWLIPFIPTFQSEGVPGQLGLQSES